MVSSVARGFDISVSFSTNSVISRRRTITLVKWKTAEIRMFVMVWFRRHLFCLAGGKDGILVACVERIKGQAPMITTKLMRTFSEG